MASDRTRLAAFLLSLPAPGLGHLYVGNASKAVAMVLLAIGASLVSYAIVLFVPWAPLNAIASLALPLGAVLGIAISAARAASRAPRPYSLQAFNRWYVYLGFWLVYVTLAYAVYLPTRRYALEAFRIPSRSMEPTIAIGDFVYIRKIFLPSPPERGALIVFVSVEEANLKVLKRVLGLPGDTLAMSAGVLSLNGQPVAEPYIVHSDPSKSEDPGMRAKMHEWQVPHLIGATDGYTPDISDWGPILVPPESLFVMGDNREASYDSRYFGFIPFANVAGRPQVVYFSVGPPDNFSPGLFSRIRWSRIGTMF